MLPSDKESISLLKAISGIQQQVDHEAQPLMVNWAISGILQQVDHEAQPLMVNW